MIRGPLGAFLTINKAIFWLSILCRVDLYREMDMKKI